MSSEWALRPTRHVSTWYDRVDGDYVLAVAAHTSEIPLASIFVDRQDTAQGIRLSLVQTGTPGLWSATIELDNYDRKTGRITKRSVASNQWPMQFMGRSHEPLKALADHIAANWVQWLTVVQFDESPTFPYRFAEGKLYGLVNGVHLGPV